MSALKALTFVSYSDLADPALEGVDTDSIDGIAPSSFIAAQHTVAAFKARRGANFDDDDDLEEDMLEEDDFDDDDDDLFDDDDDLDDDDDELFDDDEDFDEDFDG